MVDVPSHPSDPVEMRRLNFQTPGNTLGIFIIYDLTHWPLKDLNEILDTVSNVRRTQSQNINVSRLVLLFYLPNPLKPCVKLRMKM